MTCYNCKQKNAPDRLFEWIDRKDKKKKTLTMNLCSDCNLNARINYDVFGIPIKLSEKHVKDTFIYTAEIDDIYSKHFYEGIKNL